nr:MAG TPA_asm: hypothetical protein [Bacteriophage sp.]
MYFLLLFLIHSLISLLSNFYFIRHISTSFLFLYCYNHFEPEHHRKVVIL